MMTKNEFMNYEAAKVLDYVPAEIRDILSVEPVTVVKMNDQKLNGLRFMMDKNAPCPTHYLDDAYEMYQDGLDPDVIAERTAEIWAEASRNTPVAQTSNVIYQNTEDDVEDTVIPRFIKADGDLNRIFFIDEKDKALTFSDNRIAETIRRTNAKMIIFDPLTSYIGEDISINLANEVRSRMNYLIDVAKETGCAIVIVGHMNKMSGAKAMYRSLGSIDVVGSARSCLLIGTAEDNPDNKIMAVQKSNLAPKGKAIEFSIHENQLPPSYFINVGTLMEKEYFIKGTYSSHSAFIFVDELYPENGSVRTLPQNTYMSVASDNIALESKYAKHLYEEIQRNEMIPCGDYLCEVLTQFPVHQDNQLIYKIQVPVQRINGRTVL